MIRTTLAHVHVAALSHAGMSGKNNEDRYAVSSFQLAKDDPRPAVFAIVSDGIGGHRAGEVAAELAVNYISMHVAESNARKPLKIMESAIHDASQAIASHSAGKDEEQGMGATCACVWIIENKLYTSYVGDSRIYLLRGKYIQRLSIDHTWVQEAYEKGIISEEQMRDHPNVHVIRRHLGGLKLPDVDFRLRIDNQETDEESMNNQGFHLHPGDTILMCTDGLTDLVWDDEIQKTVRSQKDLKSAAEALVSLANERGGHDNITVVLLAMPRVEETTPRNGLFGWLLGGEE
ncbi:MAG TPA: protein phosphatase 2C domain-containing protein [Anaerolineales bacterium]|nr:protein phosphatase 2C domain-containing protein [Anaerolineales bacterium]HNN12936.1 protein phosphatase 2C domain-containing protein [Anaerolineales bacterium]HNO31024.1 protein phosphatase 2C domain-containing protein [Anaerolineales bacterium]